MSDLAGTKCRSERHLLLLAAEVAWPGLAWCGVLVSA